MALKQFNQPFEIKLSEIESYKESLVEQVKGNLEEFKEQLIDI